MKWYLTFIIGMIWMGLKAQSGSVYGEVTYENIPIEFANVYLEDGRTGSSTDSSGHYRITDLSPGSHTLTVSALGYGKVEKEIILNDHEALEVHFELTPAFSVLDEVVVSGTMKEVSRLDSPVPVEVYSARFFRSNPTPTIFDALQNINGVRPQINCSICNTGDIHINGLEGPYTMVLIDGMPIVSGLASVYGLYGIPQSLIDRIEVVKGPASTLYGSEAVGGLINIITRNTYSAPALAADVFATGWGEINLDLAGKIWAGNRTQSIAGLNYFNYQNPIDRNQDGFTDVTLQQRISFFNKWNFDRKHQRIFSLAGRYIYEDRWGGDMQWNKTFRGGDQIYGESIYTNRWELFGNYQLPVQEKIMLQISANGHQQDSRYGLTSYIARQNIFFGQLTWNKQIGDHDFLLGTVLRSTWYDDNTPATRVEDEQGRQINKPSRILLPGLFLQDEIQLNKNNKILLGIRYDYNSVHGNILTPRINYKWSSDDETSVLRISGGNGYRVANVFTEDHAALTGSRQVEFWEDLKPETSWNGNLNFIKKIYADNGTYAGIDASLFYTHFSNKIIPDYDTDPNKIIYQNLDGYAVSRGISMNLDLALPGGLKFMIGGSGLDVFSVEDGIRSRQLFSEHFTGVWNISYTFYSVGITLDYTGNIYSPMKLPLLSDTDPRREFSPWWSIQNLQLTKSWNNGLEMYGGIKNILNWTPSQGNPFIIARSHDPFDREVVFSPDGQVVVTPDNPFGLTFDPTYIYGPNQGIRLFMGVRYTLD